MRRHQLALFFHREQELSILDGVPLRQSKLIFFSGDCFYVSIVQELKQGLRFRWGKKYVDMRQLLPQTKRILDPYQAAHQSDDLGGIVLFVSF